MDESAVQPHVLIFPLPLQGPVNSMLKLAQLLCLAGFRVTFLNTDHVHRRLMRFTDAQSRFSHYPGFRFDTISDGLPDNYPLSGDKIIDLWDSLEATTKPAFRERLASGSFSSGGAAVTCVIADGILDFALDVCNDLGIPVIFFDTISPCAVLVYLSVPSLIEAGDLPFDGDDLDEPIKAVAGMEGFLRRRDLPSFCRSGDLSSRVMQLVLTEARQLPRARGLILNTFQEIEGPTVGHIRSLCPNLYSVGPLHYHLKTQLARKTQSPPPSSSNSLWEEDRSCMAWLDMQPTESVLYVSFGSLAVSTTEQLMEFWHGLVGSGKRFLWVIRDNAVAGDGQIPEELSPGSGGCRWCIVRWAPQEEVLGHPAVGGFLTHSGWNSTLESIVAAVPMICWPYYVDQHVNSRMVGEVWKLGLDMKDAGDRLTVEKMVNHLMDERRHDFRQSANRMAALAKASVTEGGSSFCDLNRLIEDIRLMSMQA